MKYIRYFAIALALNLILLGCFVNSDENVNSKVGDDKDVVVSGVGSSASNEQQQQQQQQSQEQVQEQQGNTKKQHVKPNSISNTVKYDVVVGLSDQLAHLQQQQQQPKTQTSVMVPMTLANGTKYQCFIPKPQNDGVDDDHQWTPIPSPNAFADSLSSLAKSQCILYKTGGWWSYEYCHGKSVRQVHIDPSQNKVTAEFVLGNAPVTVATTPSDTTSTSVTNNNNNANQASSSHYGKIRGIDQSFINSYNQGTELALPEKAPLPYYSEIYDEGTPCDILPGNRKSEIRYYCNNDPAKNFNYIQEMSEPSSCYYIFKVYTNLMCIHPLFKPKHDTVLDITCIKV